MIYIDVGRDGRVWGIDNSNRVYEREGISKADKDGTNWSKDPINGSL
jgi:hypothetical protein